MSPVLSVALIVAGFVGVIGYGYWWYNFGDGKSQRDAEAKQASDRKSRLLARGWDYEEVGEGDIRYRVRGRTEEGVEWVLHYDTDHSSSSSTPELLFRAPSLATGHYVWHIDDRPSFELAQGKVMKAIISGLASVVSKLSETIRIKSEFYATAKPLPVGGATFSKRFVLVAADARWSPLVDFETERLILNVPPFKPGMTRADNSLSAGLDPQGLMVKLYADAPSTAVIEHIIRLGETLADRCARMR
ncbi:MAG: hypothetical protein ACK5UX_12565 [Burkholderiales bacterium]